MNKLNFLEKLILLFVLLNILIGVLNSILLHKYSTSLQTISESLEEWELVE